MQWSTDVTEYHKRTKNEDKIQEALDILKIKLDEYRELALNTEKA